MRFTRVRVMYLPPAKPAKQKNPLKVEMSFKYMYAIGNMVVIGGFLIAYHVFQWIQRRKRATDTHLDATRSGKEVVIVGAGAAGSTLASSLTARNQSLRVTVFEPERESMLTTMVPYAHAGHRSYDLNTFEGRDTLYSPTSWNVTRDSKLVFRSVRVVKPDENKVVDSEGQEHTYDVLVLATGSVQDFAAVPGLEKSNYDKYSISASPGSTRDTLGCLYTGAVIHAKIPPRDPRVVFNELLRAAASVADPLIGLSGAPQKRRWWRFGASAEPSSSISQQEPAAPIASSSTSPLSYIGQQHCGTYISTTNVLWKYLDFFKKSALVPLICLSYEASPSDAMPEDFLNVVNAFWHERKVDFRPRRVLDHVAPSARTAKVRHLDSGDVTEESFSLLICDLPRVPSDPLAARSGLSAPELGGFVNVDPQTLQHKVYPNIFAIGDCAALPTVPSYGAVFTQTPIMTHNVEQVLLGRKPNARYDGYTSFNVIMTTWRHMWPEMSWPAEASTGQRLPPVSATLKLERRNEHVWDNTKWRDVRGLLQGVYVQWFMLELMHWFVFMRANWCPPNWFWVPCYPEA